MPTAYLKIEEPYSNTNPQETQNSEYYLNLILNEISECLNPNGINYKINEKISEPIQSNPKYPTSAEITLKSNSLPGPLPSDSQGIYIFFTAGNPESKRLATAISKNLQNIYIDSSNVKIITTNFQENPEETQNAKVVIGIGYGDNSDDITWIRENTEEIAKNIVMSLSEYFGLPFTSCKKNNVGMVNKDTDIRQRPSINSEVIGSLELSTKVEILGQWEDWYIVGQKGSLGYVSSKFITI